MFICFLVVVVMFVTEPANPHRDKMVEAVVMGVFAVLAVVPWIIGRAARYILAGE
jgi:hypothetical protein